MRDLVAFQARAARYLACKRVPVEAREDLVQEMVVYVLAHPQYGTMKLDFLYWNALDRLNPRHMVAGVRRRDHTRFHHAGPLAAPTPSPEAALLAAEGAQLCLAGLSGDDAWLVIWHAVDGHAMTAIAAALGCSVGRISQRLTAIRRQREAGDG